MMYGLFLFLLPLAFAKEIQLPFMDSNILMRCGIKSGKDVVIVKMNDVFAAKYESSNFETSRYNLANFESQEENPIINFNIHNKEVTNIQCTLNEEKGFGKTIAENKFSLHQAEKPRFIDNPKYGIIPDNANQEVELICQVENDLNSLITDLELTKISTGEVLARESLSNVKNPKITHDLKSNSASDLIDDYKCTAKSRISDEYKKFYEKDYLDGLMLKLDQLQAETIIHVVEHSKPLISIDQKKVYTTYNANVILNAKVTGEPFPQVWCNSTKTAFEEFNLESNNRVVRENVRNTRQIRDNNMQINLGQVFSLKSIESANDEPTGYDSNQARTMKQPKTVKYYCRAVNEYGESVSEQIEITVIPRKLEVISSENGEFSDFYDLKVSVVSGEPLKRIKGVIMNTLTRETREIDAKPTLIEESRSNEGMSYTYRYPIAELSEKSEYNLKLNGCTDHECTEEKTDFYFKTDETRDGNNMADVFKQINYINSSSMSRWSLFTYLLSVILLVLRQF